MRMCQVWYYFLDRNYQVHVEGPNGECTHCQKFGRRSFRRKNPGDTGGSFKSHSSPENSSPTAKSHLLKPKPHGYSRVRMEPAA